uniref:Reverse transcriptase domain-containing protein n=1 Tax=Tanacetum cinerariifolium TaxID=118510 RepID=A0A699HU82_TANCI|nr:hypothetical protein [Tanacetum cinerariifolium]
MESVRYGVSQVLDTVYWGFLGVGTTFDIFRNILFPYGLNMAVFLYTAYCILFPSWSLVRCRHKYAVSSLMDMAYWSSEQRYLMSSEALSLKIRQKFALLEEDKVELFGMIVKEEEEAINKVKGEALKEKDYPGEFIFPITFEGKINENTMADTGSDINTMPYRIHEKLGREEIKKVERGITMANHTQAETMGILTNVLCHVGVYRPDIDLALPSISDHKGCYTYEEEAKGQWRTKIMVTGPYGNIFVQGFTTKKTSWKLLKYHNFSDIMSPNWFIE